MSAPSASDRRLDAFAEDIRHGGEGSLFHRPARGPWRRLAALQWSWLAFPLAWWLLRHGLLRIAIALGFVAAPALALLLILADAWAVWRARRRLRQLSPG